MEAEDTEEREDHTPHLQTPLAFTQSLPSLYQRCYSITKDASLVSPYLKAPFSNFGNQHEWQLLRNHLSKITFNLDIKVLLKNKG